jgi:hypothetical protein
MFASFRPVFWVNVYALFHIVNRTSGAFKVFFFFFSYPPMYSLSSPETLQSIAREVYGGQMSDAADLFFFFFVRRLVWASVLTSISAR